MAQRSCAIPVSNDECAPGDSIDEQGAILIPVPGSAPGVNNQATDNPDDPGFCCHLGTSRCTGGTSDGTPCVVHSQCPGGSCPQPIPMPGTTGYGSVWFKFVQPAGLTSVSIRTCPSNSPARDSLLQVFKAADLSSPQTQCASLVPIGCNDDSYGCGSSGRNSRMCLHDLNPGETYYVMVAAKTPDSLGEYRVALSTTCESGSSTGQCRLCPEGKVTFVDPPDQTVDARRPHPPGVPQMSEGIRSLRVAAPMGATPDCWNVCESPVHATPNSITGVVEDPPGIYAITLRRPITVGAVTMLTYALGEPHAATGFFRSHPANVNGNSKVTAFDILVLIDSLNGVGPGLPWGPYSGDLDHSGVIAPADILTLLDLLHGDNGFPAWYGTVLPDAEGCP